MTDRIDPAPRRPLTPSERWTAGVLLGLFTLALVADLAQSATPAVWTVPFILVAWVPLLVLHEAGHALAAKAVGWRVHKIVIGFGKDVARWRFGETRVVLRRYPVEGFVVPVPVGTRLARTKNAFVYFAGPGLEMAALAALVVALGPERLLSRTTELDLLFWQSVGVAIGLGLFFNLVPHVTGDGRISDGMGILLSPTLPADYFEDAATLPVIEEADRLIEAGVPDRALRLVEEALTSTPLSVPLRAERAVCLAATGDGEAAAELLDELGKPDPKAPRRAVELCLARARVGLEAPSPERLRDAELACDRALEIRPQDATVGSTLGAVLFERGRIDEAISRLSDALSSVADRGDQARCLAYLALAAHRVGDTALAERYVDALREIDASPRLLARVTAVFARDRDAT